MRIHRLPSFTILFGLCQLLILSGCSERDRVSEEEIARITSLTAQLEEGVKQINGLAISSDYISNFEAQLRQLDGTLQSLTQNLEPVQPSEESVKQVLDILNEINALDGKKIDADVVMKSEATFNNVLAVMPQLAQQGVIQELTAIQWSLDVLQSQVQSGEPDADNLERLIAVQNYLTDKPLHAPEWLVTSLESELKKGKAESIDAVLNQAKSPSEAVVFVEKALAGLELTGEERSQLIVVNLKQRLVELEQVENPALRQSSVEDIYNTAIAMLYSALRNKDLPESTVSDLDGIISSSEAAIKEMVVQRQREEDLLRRQYSKWALQQMDSFRRDSYGPVLEEIKALFQSFEQPTKNIECRLVSEYPSFKKGLEEILGESIAGSISPAKQSVIYERVYSVVEWKNADELAKIVTRDAIVKYLLPIDERYLDMMVGKLFAKLYDDNIIPLQGTEHHLYVAQMSVDTERVLPSDFTSTVDEVAKEAMPASQASRNQEVSEASSGKYEFVEDASAIMGLRMQEKQ